MQKLWIKSIITICLSFLFTACFVVEPVPSEYDKKKDIYTQKTAQAKDSIKAYITKNIASKRIYKAYDYSELYELKPKDIEEYENLIIEKNRLPLLENTYHGQLEQREKELNELIAKKKQYIKENKIYTSYEMGHIFSLKEPDSTIVTEQIFYFYPNFSVKDLNVNYYLKLDNIELLNYERFIYNSSLFNSFDSYTDEKNDAIFYNNLKTELDKHIDKNMFLKHIITLTGIAYNQEYLEANYTCKELVRKYLSKQNNINVEILKYKALQTPQEGISTDKTYSYLFEYETTLGEYVAGFNNFLEIVEISKK